MKQVKIEKYEVGIEGQKEKIKIDEGSLIYQSSRYKDPPKEGRQAQQMAGFSYSEFKTFARIDEALLAADKTGVLKLEDAEFEEIFGKLKRTKWFNASKEMVSAVLKVIDKFEKAAKKEEKE